ncbi:MAG TPA: helix-turn-helix domain-containing protein [Planctomycetota bacterium]|nr:helix-turn-helix domain-containing protein [Planctomycetota bacterium]
MKRNQPTSSIPDAYFEFGLASRRDEPQPFDRFHRHNEVELVLVEAGRVTYLFSHGREACQAGDEVVFWGAMPHQLVAVEPGSVLHWLTVPLAWFLEWQLPKAFADAVLEGAVLRRGRSDQGGAVMKSAGRDEALTRFLRWHADLQSQNADRRKIVLLEAEACLRRMALEDRAAVADSAAGEAIGEPAATRFVGAGPGAKVEAMAQFIARNYTRPLRVAAIAAHVDLHPDYANTLFRQTCGRSLIEYVTEHRISHAQRLLATTDRKILDIALAAGFRTPSRFYAAFEASTGCAPRAYRVRFTAKD